MISDRPVVYDAGALLAAEADNRTMWRLHGDFNSVERTRLIPSAVITQAWRGGSRQALLARFLKTCTVDATRDETARIAGELIARSGKQDAVDAIVVATAVVYSAIMIVTSDPEDISALCKVVSAPRTPLVRAI